MVRFTLTLTPELYNLIQDRAKFNIRSMNGEVIYLVECALAEEIESNRQIMRTLMMASGGIKNLPRPAPEDHSPERTETDESSNESSA